MAATDPCTADHKSTPTLSTASANNLFSLTEFGSVGAGAVSPPLANQDSHAITPNSGEEFSSHLLCPFLLNQPPINGVTFEIPTSL